LGPLHGGVELLVSSRPGPEAVASTLGPGDFVREVSLLGQQVVRASTILLIGEDEMVTLLHQAPPLSDRFIAHILTRNYLMETDPIAVGTTRSCVLLAASSRNQVLSGQASVAGQKL
jgi:CRP-like cAMP-binding protein